jgi:hypothetical protein
MFCSACGAPVQPTFTVCPNCQRPIPSVLPVTPQGRLDHHLHILGTLWVIAGALFVIPGFVLMMISGVVRLAVPATETIGLFVALMVLSIIGGSLFLVAAGGIFVGWGLLKHQPWARLAAIVLASFRCSILRSARPWAFTRCGFCYPIKAVWNTTGSLT